MTMKNNNASYVSGSSEINIVDPENDSRLSGSYKTSRDFNNLKKTPMRKIRGIASVLTAALAIIFILVSFIPSFSSIIPASENDTRGTNVSSANAMFCSTSMGFYMDGKGNWENGMTNVPFSSDKNRTWTLQEAIGSYPAFVNYHGEGEGSNWLVNKKEPNDHSEKIVQKDKAEQLRTLNNCFIEGIPTLLANGVIGLSGMITGMSQFFAVKAFDPDFICASADKNSPENIDGCVNIMSIIGGNSSGTDKGIIGVLTDGIYFPLIVLIVAAAAFWVGYKGIVKRQLREAAWGALWIFLAAIIGAGLLMKPAMLVSAPMKVSNAVTSCVLGAFSANNCFTGNSTNGDAIVQNDTSSLICNSSSPNSGTLSRQMKMSVNNMTCNIWKAFVLNPYSVGSFGASYDEFESKSARFGGLIARDDNKMPDSVTPETYCISLTAGQSYDDMVGKTAYFDGTKNICNLVAYQLILQNNIAINDDNGTKYKVERIDGKSDSRWYNVVYASQSTTGMWSSWTGSYGQLTAAGMSLFMSILGTVIIFITSLMALVYYISAAILMSLAPLFLLFAIHPGKGKALMLGWLEKVVSNVLKYIASAIFLVITIAMYSALLQSISNIAITLLLVLIVSLALFLYRKEIVDLIGKVNMGGEQLSSKFSDTVGGKAQSALKKSKALAVGAAGGAIGAKIAGGSAFSGFKDGTMREVKKGQGIIANSARQMDRNSVANRQDLNREQQRADIAARGKSDIAATRSDDLVAANNVVSERESELGNARTNLEHQENQVDKFSEIHGSTLESFVNNTKAELHDKIAKEIEINFKGKLGNNEQNRLKAISDLDVKRDSGVINDIQHTAQIHKVNTQFKQSAERIKIDEQDAMSQIDNRVKAHSNGVDSFAQIENQKRGIDESRADYIIAESTNDTVGMKKAENDIKLAEHNIEKMTEALPKGFVEKLNTEFTSQLKENLSAHNLDVSENMMESLAIADVSVQSAEKNLSDALLDKGYKQNAVDFANNEAIEAHNRVDAYTKVTDGYNPGDLVTKKGARKRVEANLDKIEKSDKKINSDKAREKQSKKADKKFNKAEENNQ